MIDEYGFSGTVRLRAGGRVVEYEVSVRDGVVEVTGGGGLSGYGVRVGVDGCRLTVDLLVDRMLTTAEGKR